VIQKTVRDMTQKKELFLAPHCSDTSVNAAATLTNNTIL
jgi:hypothetical protein